MQCFDRDSRVRIHYPQFEIMLFCKFDCAKRASKPTGGTSLTAWESPSSIQETSRNSIAGEYECLKDGVCIDPGI